MLTGVKQQCALQLGCHGCHFYKTAHITACPPSQCSGYAEVSTLTGLRQQVCITAWLDNCRYHNMTYINACCEDVSCGPH